MKKEENMSQKNLYSEKVHSWYSWINGDMTSATVHWMEQSEVIRSEMAEGLLVQNLRECCFPMISSSPSSPQLTCDSWQYLDSRNKYRWLTESLCRPGQLTISCPFLENTYWEKKKKSSTVTFISAEAAEMLRITCSNRVHCNQITSKGRVCMFFWREHVYLGRVQAFRLSNSLTWSVSYRKSKGREVTTQHL